MVITREVAVAVANKPAAMRSGVISMPVTDREYLGKSPERGAVSEQ